MQSTTYRGDAIIDGESIDAELRLDLSHMRLALADGTEVLAWPLVALDVRQDPQGAYRLRLGEESFAFVPIFDDGLDAEIESRQRLAGGRPAPSPAVVAPSLPAAHRPRPSAGRPHRRGVLDGRDLSLRTAIGALLFLAGVVLAVATLAGRDPNPATVVATAPEPTVATIPPAVAGVTITAPPPTPAPTTPPEATEGPVDTAAPPSGVFAGGPRQLLEMWNTVAAGVPAAIAASDLAVEEGGYAFRSGEFVSVSGALDDAGNVVSLRVLGDPSGGPSDDRNVLAALGIALATVDPSWSADTRREILWRLGLDVARPRLDGLDGRLVLEGVSLALYWDVELARIVLEAAPAAGS